VSDDDAHVTLAFWGDGIRHAGPRTRASVTDIAPTLARILGVTPDSAVQGRVLTEVLK
jgi:arylsulfatase A-like enzyme